MSKLQKICLALLLGPLVVLVVLTALNARFHPFAYQPYAWEFLAGEASAVEKIEVLAHGDYAWQIGFGGTVQQEITNPEDIRQLALLFRTLEIEEAEVLPQSIDYGCVGSILLHLNAEESVEPQRIFLFAADSFVKARLPPNYDGSELFADPKGEILTQLQLTQDHGDNGLTVGLFYLTVGYFILLIPGLGYFVYLFVRSLIVTEKQE